jgi:uncharacterized protein (TIGR02246 family)
MTTRDTPAGRDIDRRAIQRLLAELAAAWNAGDADAYGALFTEDASYITWLGQLALGRSEIADMHRWLFTKIPGTRMAPSVKTHQQITFLSTEVALVIGSGDRPALPDQESTHDRSSTVSFVAVHRPDGWRFAHFQNTGVTAIPSLGQTPR